MDINSGFRVGGCLSDADACTEPSMPAEAAGRLHTCGNAALSHQPTLVARMFHLLANIGGRILAARREHPTVRAVGTIVMIDARCLQVLSYFREYHPAYVEWLDDSSCNILFRGEAVQLPSAKTCALFLHSQNHYREPAVDP